jgi:hypothetical protein
MHNGHQMSDSCHLSVVATARNDNHGGSFLYRMQHFVDGFIEQCKRHQLKAELIIVEWNPPEETEPLYKALQFPSDRGQCAIRFIQVPKEVHMKLQHADQLPLYQMIAKNVGIRRALGQFVLATNIDILFSDELIQFIRDRLKKGHLYRVDRLDVPSELPPKCSLKEILEFCDLNCFRINGKYGTWIKVNGCWKSNTTVRDLYNKTIRCTKKTVYKLQQKIGFAKEKGVLIRRLVSFSVLLPFKTVRVLYVLIRKSVRSPPLLISWAYLRLVRRLCFKSHTNACGDFTLLSSVDWMKLKGYPEWEMFSWHIDSVLLYQAKSCAIKEVDLPRKMAAYHIEHGFASGYTPEAYEALFNRLKDKGIPYLSNADIDEISFKAMKAKEPIIYNDDNWGMAHISLEEVRI